MSNNIYDIMNKLNAVANKDMPVAKKESTDKTLLESTMKEVLNEKYMGFGKTVAAIKKGGSAKDPEAVAASIGREKYGKEKFQAAAAKGKKLGERRLSERMPMGSVPAPELGPFSYKPADQTDDDVADVPMSGNKLSPKDQYQAIKKDVEHVQQGRRGLKPGFNLEKDSDVGRFAAPGYGDQGQFFQEDDMEEGNLFTGNLAKARAQGKKRADLDGDGDMETVREGAKPDYIGLDKDGNRKESMKKAAADKKKQGVAEGFENTPSMIARLFSDNKQLFDMATQGNITPQLKKLVSIWGASSPWGENTDTRDTEWIDGTIQHLLQNYYPSWKSKQGVAEGQGSLIPGKFYVVTSIYGKIKAVKGPFDDDGEAEYEKAEYSGGGKRDAAVAQWTGRAWNFDYTDSSGQGVAEGTKETSTGRVHRAEPGGYGRKDDDEDGDKKKAEPAVKRGRGRPKKDADSETGEVKKYGNAAALQSFMVGNLPKGKLPGKTTTKHKIKDEPDEKLDEKAPPGAKAERMVKHIKQGYAKDGNLTDKEKGIAYAKAKNAGKVEESIPPGFPRSLAKKIYEHFDGNVDHTLDVMWKIHNTVMESQSLDKKKLSESMAFEQSTTAPTQKPVMGTYKGGVWTADPPKKGEVGVPVPQNIDGGSAPAPAKSKPVKTQKKAEVDTNTDLAEMLNLAGIKSQVDEAELTECGMSSSPISGSYGSNMHNTDGRMNISTNMSTDGNKSVTITADGDAAAELMQMLKIAGLNSDGMSNVKDGEDLDHPGSVEIHGTMDSDGAEELAKKLRTAELDEAKDKRYHANTTPEEEVLPVQTQLKGGDGEVAGKEKKMKPHGYKFSDNPLSMKESMSLKLMKEYEGIKKAV